MNATPPSPPFAVIGLGRMGSALLRALTRAFPEKPPVAIDADPKVRSQVVLDRLVAGAEEAPGPSLSTCGLVFLCVPIRDLPQLLPTLGPHLGPDTVLSDTSPVMKAISDLVEEHLPQVRYVGGHPLIAPQRGGPAPVDPFVGRPVALCPREGEESLAAGVGTVWAALGARPVVLTPEQHDQLIAATSHAPFLAAVAMARIAGALDGAGRLIARSLDEALRPAHLPADSMAAAVSANPFAPAAARVLADELLRLADLAEQDPAGLLTAAREGVEAKSKLLSESTQGAKPNP